MCYRFGYQHVAVLRGNVVFNRWGKFMEGVPLNWDQSASSSTFPYFLTTMKWEDSSATHICSGVPPHSRSSSH